MVLREQDLPLTTSGKWGVSATWGADPSQSINLNEDVEMKIASVSKLLLLAACASLIESKVLNPDELLDRREVEVVGGSGLWQHLSQDVLPLRDVATLVASTSDNIATNVLLRRVGLSNVQESADYLGVKGLFLHDQVRNFRDKSHAETLGTGTAKGLADFMSRVSKGELGGRETSRWVRGWLSKTFDLTQVASAFHLDALSHPNTSPESEFMNKTGTDAGVRADAGFIRVGHGSLTYAVVANWDEAEGCASEVLDSMRAVGSLLLSSANTLALTDSDRDN